MGFESPREHMQRGLSDCLRAAARWAADDAAGARPAAAASASASAASASASAASPASLDGVWALIAELYERPLEGEGDNQRTLAPPPAPSSSSSASSSSFLPPAGAAAALPRGFSEADNWQLLLWAALLCAQDWHRAQTTGSLEAASRYQETLLRVRRLVPFVELLPAGAG